MIRKMCLSWRIDRMEIFAFSRKAWINGYIQGMLRLLGIA